jgi:antitoxin component of RelBE/YafQ-DinJ toxin-antitoxin module
MFTRIAEVGALPFDPFEPTDETIKAIEAARRGDGKVFNTVEEFAVERPRDRRSVTRSVCRSPADRSVERLPRVPRQTCY